MGRLLDELDLLQQRLQDVDLGMVEVKVQRMSLGKILLQKLEKLEKEGLIEKPFQRKQLKIRFPELGQSGRIVLAIKNLQFGFGDKYYLERNLEARERKLVREEELKEKAPKVKAKSKMTERKFPGGSRRCRPSNKASENLTRLKMRRGGSERHRYQPDSSVSYSASCAACYDLYINESTGIHQQGSNRSEIVEEPKILLPCRMRYIICAVTEGGLY